MSLTDALLLDPYPFEIWISNRSDAKGSGTLNDPFWGGDETKFDAIMNSLPVGTVGKIHLGPGTFKTRGYADGVSGGWQPRAGWKITGSGIDATILQLVGATSGNTLYFAIGHALRSGSVSTPMDGLEISDLTIDCNLSANGGTAACGAIRIMGNHTRICRVKAINWGTKTNQVKCYVFAAIIADSFADGVTGDPLGTQVNDTGMEDCIAITPGTSPSDSVVVVFHAGAGDPYPPAVTGPERFGRGAVIKNCFVDCDSIGSSPNWRPQFRGLSMGTCLDGVVEGNQVLNTWFAGPYQEKVSTRQIVVARNAFKNVVTGPFWNLGRANTTVNVSSLSRDGTTATATTGAKHYLVVGDRIKIDSADSVRVFKGIFKVSAVPSNLQFSYLDAGAPGSATSPTFERIFGVEKALVEGNLIDMADLTSQPNPPAGTPAATDPPIAIRFADGAPSFPLTPDYVHGQIIVRDNFVRILDGKNDQTYLAQAVRVEGAKAAVIRENVIALQQINPDENFRCGKVTYFNNKTPSGTLVQGFDPNNGTKFSEEAEDALLMTFA